MTGGGATEQGAGERGVVERGTTASGAAARRAGVRTAELVLDARADLGEGPRWDADAGLLDWLDVTRGLWHRMTPAGRIALSRRLGDRVSCVRPRRDGGWVAAVDGAVVLLDRSGVVEERSGDGAFDDVGAPLDRSAVEERGWNLALPLGAVLNDGGCDAAGRLLVGAVAPDLADGSLLRVDPDRAVTTLRRGVAMANGLDWSPDGRVLYLVDSAAGTVLAFSYDVADGSIGNPRVLIRVPPHEGMPDGLAVADDGALWLAIWGAGQVRRHAPDGRLDGCVTVPASQVTSCALGGGRLWITTARQGLSAHALDREQLAGGVFACDVSTGPTARQRFAG